MYCGGCKGSWHEGVVRYKVIVHVADDSGDAPMLIWDRECAELGNKSMVFCILMKKDQVESYYSVFSLEFAELKLCNTVLVIVPFCTSSLALTCTEFYMNLPAFSADPILWDPGFWADFPSWPLCALKPTLPYCSPLLLQQQIPVVCYHRRDVQQAILDARNHDKGLVVVVIGIVLQRYSSIGLMCQKGYQRRMPSSPARRQYLANVVEGDRSPEQRPIVGTAIQNNETKMHHSSSSSDGSEPLADCALALDFFCTADKVDVPTGPPASPLGKSFPDPTW
nr:replication protein A 70 kDa DNA-binding subunit B-like [Ipomoea batatas]